MNALLRTGGDSFDRVRRNSVMLRKVFAILAVAIIALSSLRAETFELQAKKLKVNKKNADVFPELELRPAQNLDIEKEPKYKSDHPQKFSAVFGIRDAASMHSTPRSRHKARSAPLYLFMVRPRTSVE